jgi:hypothetical protein
MPNDWRAVPREHRSIAWIYRHWYEVHRRRFAAEPGFVLTNLWAGNLSMPREHMLRVGFEGLDVDRGVDDRHFGLRCLKAGIRGEYDDALRAEHRYDRDLAAFRRDSRIQGESRRMLRAAHPDVVGDPTGVPQLADTVGMNLPRAVRRVLPLAARDPVHGPLTGAIERLHRAAVRQGHLGAEVFTARGLATLDVMRGVLDGAARVAAGRPSPGEDVHRGVVAGDAADAAAAPGPGAAQDDARVVGRDAPGVAGVVAPRPVEGAVEDVAGGEAKLALEVER